MQVGKIPFDVDESNAVEALALWCRVMAFVHFAGAVLSLLGGCLSSVGLLGIFSGEAAGFLVAAVMGVAACALVVGAVIMALQGVWLMRAADSFSNVVRTDGMDQELLVAGFDRIRAYFWVEAVFAALGVLSALAAVAGTLLR